MNTHASSHDLCGIDDVKEGEILRGALPNGHAVAIYRVDGAFFVTDDLCSHGEASLSEDGSLDGHEVECSWASLCNALRAPDSHLAHSHRSRSRSNRPRGQCAMSEVDFDLLDRRVRVAARALARHGLVQAWGHCSARVDDKHLLVCAAKPMGQIEIGEPGVIVPIEGSLPEGVLGEVRIHQQIYRLRPDVGGICRIMPPITMALSTLGLTPTPRHGVGAFHAACRYWDDPRLLRDDNLAAALAEHLGDAPSLVMRAY